MQTVRERRDRPCLTVLLARGRPAGRPSRGAEARLKPKCSTMSSCWVDAVARRLLTQTLARDLEITARGLEEAFIAMTGDGAAGPSGESQAAT
jgi:hypothetical protein